MDKKERNRAAIFSTLDKMGGPVSAATLAKLLAAAGHTLSARTVRLYLSELNAEGLTAPQGKRRRITKKGLAELRVGRGAAKSAGRVV